MSDPSLGFEIQRLEEQFAAHPGSLLFARLADLLRKSGELDRALAVVEEGLSQHPDYLSAHIVHARTLEDMGREVQAGEAYRGVLDVDAQNLVALRSLAHLAETRGDREEAAGWYERLLAVDPRNEEAEAALERLAGGGGPESGPEAEPAAEEELEPPEPEPEADPVPEFEPEPVPGLEPDLEAESRSGTDGEIEPELDTGPIDAFGLEFGSEAEWESIGSSGWPWSEEASEPEVTGHPGSSAEEPAEPVDPVERTGTYWPEWGGEALEAGAPWAEPGEEPLEPLEEEEAERAATDVQEPEVSEPIAAEAEPEPESEPEEATEAPGPSAERSDSDLPTETLATLYATQGLYREAVTIYEELVRRRPHDEALAERLRAARDEFESDGPAGPESIGEVGETAPEEEEWAARESVPTEPTGPVEPPVRDHLRALLRGDAVADAGSADDLD
ncbi:MAG: hypothetical protein Q8W51_11220 [Candidatus Palauibacterales bacterium]|nr:hypothetical protein [Candidatus Palauibacterales bacterium]MDP2530291.1 hypothetical protein [Candidatus Palauibacterales bacterium]MDP2583076.1 hypothetical protein [Candidatus Palauibacterales bacterium]